MLDTVIILSEVKDEMLEDSVVKIFNKLGCSIDADYIEACHWVSKNNKMVIVKFTRRKDCQKFCNKKRIKEPQNGEMCFTWAKKNIYQY